MAMLCIHLGLMMFTLQDNLTLRSVYLASKKIFAVSLIPALIVFVLMQIGISLPHITLAADVGKDMTGQSYQLYAGLATMLRNNGGLLNRLCGMYREPGFVGTIGALFLLGDKISLRKWENVIILAASLCTFSLAFVVMLLLGVMLRAVGNMRKRRNMVAGVAVVFAVIVGYFVFMSLPLDSNSALGELQGRLVITEDGGLAGDNRFGSSEWAEEAYDAFLNSSLKIRLFGYGADYRAVPGTDYSIWQSVCSYKEFVFSFGFLGLIILGIGFILSVFVKYRGVRGGQKWNIFVLLTIFLVSIYQRFDVANFHYFCVLFGGASNLALMGVETEKDASSDSKSGSRRIVFRWASAEKERF